MGEITFVRHGQASFGAADYDRLSELGRQQSRWLGAHLAATARPFDRIVTGTLRRHRQTLQAMLETLSAAPPVAEDPRLNEMPYFEIERAFVEQTGAAPVPGDGGVDESAAAFFRRVLAAWEAGRIDGVPESYAQFRDRVTAAFGDHAAEGERVLLVSSGGPLGVAMAHVLGLELHAMTDVILHTHNASYSRFMVRGRRFRLLQFNAIPHLEHPDRWHAQTLL